MSVKEVLELITTISAIAKVAGEALLSGDTRRVDEIIPAPLRHELAQAGARLKAQEKFGTPED